MSKKKRILFFRFSPVTKVPRFMNQFDGWWNEELVQNQQASPIDTFEITESGLKGDKNRKEGLRTYRVWLELRKAHQWLMDRL